MGNKQETNSQWLRTMTKVIFCTQLNLSRKQGLCNFAEILSAFMNQAMSNGLCLFGDCLVNMTFAFGDVFLIQEIEFFSEGWQSGRLHRS